MNELGKGKRKHVPNTAIQEHLRQVTKTKATVEKNCRAAVIRKEREDMAREQPDPIREELLADEALVARLQRKIKKRDPTCEVEYLDLDELKTLWAELREADAASLKPHPQIAVLGSVRVDSASQPKKTMEKMKPNPRSSGGHASSRPQPKSNADPRPSKNRQAPSGKGKAAREEVDSELEEIRLDDEEDEGAGDDEGERQSVHTKKPKKENKSRKPTKEYDGLERRLVEKAYEHLLPKSLQSRMYLFNTELDEYIEECWDLAKADLKIDPDEFPCTDQNRETIKTRLNGFCSHVRNQAVSRVPGHYGFANVPTAEVAARAKLLLPNNFHLNPKAKTGGRYQHSIINEMLCFALATGRKPPASRHPDYFWPLMLLETIAFVCAVLEFVIDQFSLSDDPDREKFDKMEFGPTRKKWLTHLSSLEVFNVARPSIVEAIQKRAWESVAGKLGATLKVPDTRPLVLENALTIHDFDDECEPTDEESPAPGPSHAPPNHASSLRRRSANSGKQRATSPESADDVFQTKRSTRSTHPTSPALNALPLSESDDDKPRPPVRPSKSLRGKADKAESESDGKESASTKDSEAEEDARAAVALEKPVEKSVQQPVRMRRQIESSEDEAPTNNAARDGRHASGRAGALQRVDQDSSDDAPDQVMGGPLDSPEADTGYQGGGHKAALEPNTPSPDRGEAAEGISWDLWPATTAVKTGAKRKRARADDEPQIEDLEPEKADNRHMKARTAEQDVTDGKGGKRVIGRKRRQWTRGKGLTRERGGRRVTSPRLAQKVVKEPVIEATPRCSGRDRKPSATALLAAAASRR
ncbi:hypothetical protein FRC08_001261 [Ceratobasidium sp. 394]|nr:hypothetical protein FRC08_001261 [Ceratobasidium sp. 394]